MGINLRGHRADDTEAMGNLGGVGERLAEMSSRNPGGDGAERVADLRRGVGLGVEGFVLWGASGQKDEDAGLGLTKPGACSGASE